MAPERGSAAIYWGGYEEIGAANLDGSAIHVTLPSGSLPSQLDAGTPCGVAVNASYLYWNDVSSGSIRRADLDGTDPHVLIAGGEKAEGTCGIAIDRTHVYWPESSGKGISRANLDGTNLESSFVTGTEHPYGVAVDGEHLYWADLGTESIGRANINGNEVEPELIPRVEGTSGIAVGDGHLFWSTFYGSIGRAAIDGTEANPNFITGGSRICGTAVDSTHIYWANEVPSDRGIGSANLDGSAVNQHLIQPTTVHCGVAVDGRTLSPPVSNFSIGHVIHDRRRGTVTVSATVPSGGFLDVEGRGVDWKPVSPADMDKYGGIHEAGTVRLRLWLHKGSRLRKQLQRRRVATASLDLSFRVVPVDFAVWLNQLSTTRSKAVKFVRRPATRHSPEGRGKTPKGHKRGQQPQ